MSRCEILEGDCMDVPSADDFQRVAQVIRYCPSDLEADAAALKRVLAAAKKWTEYVAGGP